MNFKKILSVFLSLSIIFSLLAVPVNAQEAEEIIDTPVVEEPIEEEPIVEESIVEEPIVEDPVVEEPVIEEPIGQAQTSVVRTSYIYNGYDGLNNNEDGRWDGSEEEDNGALYGGYGTHRPPFNGHTTHEYDKNGKCVVCGQSSSHEHRWADRYSHNETHHWKECTRNGCWITDIEQNKDYAPHRYGWNGKCFACGYQVSHEHDWADEFSYDETHHWYECEGTYGVCDKTANSEKEGYAAHTLNETGKCDCGYQAPHQHNWSDEYSHDETHHWYDCEGAYGVCDKQANSEKEGYASHEYDENGECAVCGYHSNHIHSWNRFFTSNEEGHWYECYKNGCWITDVEHNKGYAPHKYNENGRCVFCSYRSSHVHNWDRFFTSDEEGHWHECNRNGCWITEIEHNKDYAPHRYNWYGKCVVCGYQAPHQHDWKDTYSYDDKYHWHECEGVFGICDKQENSEKDGYAAHQLSATGKCDCGYQAPHQHDWKDTYTYDNKYHWHECEGAYGVCDKVANSDKEGYAEHTLNETGKCECGYQAPHEHDWAEEYSYDETHHWHECEGAYGTCDKDANYEKFGFAQHVYWWGRCVCGHQAPHKHDWADKYSYDETHHWRECENAYGVCDKVANSDKEGYAAHTLNETGKCDCGYQAPHEHERANTYTYDNKYHWYECEGAYGVCDKVANFNKEGYAKHILNESGKCDCGYQAPHEHKRAHTYSYDNKYHWIECVGAYGTCDKDANYEKFGFGHHVYWWGKCICGHQLVHCHDWADAYTYDETHHWHECESGYGICGKLPNSEKKGYAEHILDGNGRCECGYQAQHNHVAADVFTYADGYHWKECVGEYLGACDNTVFDYAAHTLDEKGTCVCGYHKHVAVGAYTFDETHHWNKCAEATACAEIQLNKDEHTLDASGKCNICDYQALHVHDRNVPYTTSHPIYHWKECVGPYGVCDDKVSDKAEHVYDAETNMCVCGKVKPVSDITDITEEEKNIGDASLAGSEEENGSAVLTQEEIEVIDKFGLDVDIWLEVEDATASVGEDDKQIILALLDDYNGYEIGKYLDIELWKQLDTFDAERVTELSRKITVELELPEELKNEDSYTVRRYAIIRLHGDKAEIIPCEYDETTNMLSFETDRFSNYTIVYKDTVVKNESGGHVRDFWDRVKDVIEKAESGDTIKVNAGNHSEMPASVMRTLAENSGVILEINWNGGGTIVIPADKALTEKGRAYYLLSYLEEYYFGKTDGILQNPETGGYLEITAPAISETILDTKLPTAAKTVIEEAGQNTAEQSAKLDLSWVWMLLAIVVLVVEYYHNKRKSNNT